MNHSYEYGDSVIPLGRKTQATEAIGDELQAPKPDGFARVNPMSVWWLPSTMMASFGE
jgi:hypothetical protein